MTDSPVASSSAVTRHLHYAWIEFGHTGDAEAFVPGLDALGWKNIVSYLPRVTDAAGTRFRDPNYPNVPIRWVGSSCLILPNTVKDVKWNGPLEQSPWIDDPVLTDCRTSAGSAEAFSDQVRADCAFLSNWVLSPGLKRTSDTEANLTTGEDATHFVDLIACSGHGATGTVWGGNSNLGLEFGPLIEAGGGRAASSDRLKYLLLPTCYNVAEQYRDQWIPIMRRSKPLHGLFGYGKSYPGGDSGASLFRAFAAGLKANEGRTPILQAYRNAHAGTAFSQRWAALIHASSKADTMRDWLADALPAPDPAGELRWFCEANWPTGEVLTPRTPVIEARFHMGPTEINASNHSQLAIGLFPGESGHLRIVPATPAPAGQDFYIKFYFFRPEKDGMDLNKLLRFTSLEGAGWKATLANDMNMLDRTAFDDALFIKTSAPTSEFIIPFAVREDAPRHYPVSQGAFFWMSVEYYIEEEGTNYVETFYPDGAWLREPRSTP